LPMIFIDVARYLRRTWPELFVVEPGFAGLHRRIDPFARDSPLEERVSSEPVSEVGFLGPGNTARFREVYG